MAFRLIDTNIVSHILNGHTLAAVYQPHLTGYDLAVSFRTVGELLEGAALAGWGPARWSGLQALLATLTALDGTADVAARRAEVLAARNGSGLRIVGSQRRRSPSGLSWSRTTRPIFATFPA